MGFEAVVLLSPAVCEEEFNSPVVLLRRNLEEGNYRSPLCYWSHTGRKKEEWWAGREESARPKTEFRKPVLSSRAAAKKEFEAPSCGCPPWYED